jgi:hypothetical protein
VLIVSGLIILILVVAAVVYFSSKSKKHAAKRHSKKHSSQSTMGQSQTGQAVNNSPSVSGHYYLQSLANNMYLNADGSLQDNITKASNFYINVTNMQINPVPAVGQGSSMTKVHLSNAGVALAVVSTTNPMYYLSAGNTMLKANSNQTTIDSSCLFRAILVPPTQ